MSVVTLAMILAVLHGAPEVEPLEVMSYNVRYGSADDGPDAWDHRKDQLVALIRDHDPDVIGTQECLDFQAAYVAAELPAYAWLGQGRQEDGTGEMTAILYKKSELIPLESGHLWLSETPDLPGSKSWDSSLPRIASWVKFYRRASGQVFYFYNTHFDHKGAIARVESARLLAARIQERHREDFVVLTGDFNAPGGASDPWKALTEFGLVDTWDSADERLGEANTWNGFKAPEPGQARRIDWILTTPGAHVERCEIDDRHASGRFPSDHMPVIARIRAPGTGE